MLIGNPDSFAIWFDEVESWSTDRFKNGCFAYFVGGQPILSLNSTLGVDLNLLSVLHCLKSDAEDERVFNLSASSAYAELVEKAFPDMDSDAIDNDYRHLISVGSLSDDGHEIFIVEWQEQARIIWGRRKHQGDAQEIYLRRGEFQDVVRSAVDRFFPGRIRVSSDW